MQDNRYDAIIIGAGIGGLVCANYLAQKGEKVLVVEKNNQPGGYCTSFKRRGFVFDTTIHAIQDCADGSILNKVFTELKIKNKIRLVRANPTDTIITPNYKINILNNSEETIAQFLKIFPKESNNIKIFFDLLLNRDLVYMISKFKKWTFQDVLDIFFADEEIKALFGIFLSNIGSLPHNTSSLTAYALLKKFILFGGYYPMGGMQVIPDSLVLNFKENGGSILLKTQVERIVLKNNRVEGVMLDGGEVISSKRVISNSDLTNTITNLLKLDGPILKKLNSFKPSLSIYIVYLTLDVVLKNRLEFAPGIWYLPSDYNLNNVINSKDLRIMANKAIFCSIASKLDASLPLAGFDYLRIMINTECFDEEFWKNHSKRLSETLIKQVESFIPGLSEHVTCIGRATPLTMKNYTLNRDGAVCGWLNSPHQLNESIVSYLPEINNLFFVGHWITQRYGNGGVAMAAESGRKVAKKILGVRNV